MEIWESIRLRCRRDGAQIKPTARELGIAPNTLRKYLRQDTPPKSKTLPRPKVLDRYHSHIDELIRSTPRITAARIGSYLRQNVDADLRIGERALRIYVADRRKVLVPREAFIRAAYAPGDQSQFDFSPMSVYLGGVLVVVQLFVLRLSYSGRFIARAAMRCDQPALFAGLLAGFTAFGGRAVMQPGVTDRLADDDPIAGSVWRQSVECLRLTSGLSRPSSSTLGARGR